MDRFLKMMGVKLLGMVKSVGTIIKSAAIQHAIAAKTRENLGNEQTNPVYLGLNSICDLSNNNSNQGLQKLLFYRQCVERAEDPGVRFKEYEPSAEPCREMPVGD
ncbi:hypothetical protein INT46_010290 [Mucor plumbeus]|uniref:Uncharacterized protein n=1 Tax=Mucor plumbeus TaxID=97098 RepID=A0A8H7R448_9FUNG|nr:hypothetical protein INT46_010290 [Mucor plumbeus]